MGVADLEAAGAGTEVAGAGMGGQGAEPEAACGCGEGASARGAAGAGESRPDGRGDQGFGFIGGRPESASDDENRKTHCIP